MINIIKKEYERHIPHAIQILKNSSQRYYYLALLMNGNQVVSRGFNQYIGNNVTQARYCINSPHGKSDFYIHAERSAIESYMLTRGLRYEKKIEKFKRHNFTLVVLSITLGGNLRNSKPCDSCVKFLKEMSLKRLVYYEANCDFIEVNISNLNSSPSGAYKYKYNLRG